MKKQIDIETARPRRPGTFTQTGFLLAAASSAVGLGNLWKFPYITWENDGGSFVIVYLFAIVLIGVPIMLAELLIGRYTGRSVVGAFSSFAASVPGGRLWTLVGALGIMTGLVLLSYYSVVAGWSVYFVFKTALFKMPIGNGAGSDSGWSHDFNLFAADPLLQPLLQGLFIALTVIVVLYGVRGGIERAARILMPLLFGILLILAFNAARSPGFSEAMGFLFHLGPIKPTGILEAVGHAFFTLSLGLGAMITYASYAPRRTSLLGQGILISVLDTLFALMSSVVMFTVIFGVSVEMRQAKFTRSNSILFTTMPELLFDLPGGAFLCPIFYLLVAFAALTSTIALLELGVSYLVDQWQWSRPRASIAVGLIVWGAGIASALSLGAVDSLSRWAPLGEKNQGVFATLDFLVTNWLLPIGGFLIAVFCGWILPRRILAKELQGSHSSKLLPIWRFALRVLCPIAIVCILISVLRGWSFN